MNKHKKYAQLLANSLTKEQLNELVELMDNDVNNCLLGELNLINSGLNPTSYCDTEHAGKKEVIGTDFRTATYAGEF